VQPYLPTSISSENYGYYEDPPEVDLYNKMLHEPDPEKQHADMNAFEKLVMDTQAHATKILWWNRIIPYRSYVKGFKISPSHYINQDLATIWLDR
jgi:peptide/nickel transport system substrate-binding protein